MPESMRNEEIEESREEHLRKDSDSASHSWNDPHSIDSQEAADLLKISRTRLSQLTSKGLFSTERKKVGDRSRVFYKLSELLSYQRNQLPSYRNAPVFAEKANDNENIWNEKFLQNMPQPVPEEKPRLAPLIKSPQHANKPRSENRLALKHLSEKRTFEELQTLQDQVNSLRDTLQEQSRYIEKVNLNILQLTKTLHKLQNISQGQTVFQKVNQAYKSETPECEAKEEKPQLKNRMKNRKLSFKLKYKNSLF